ncbi:MAG: glycosyltransferase [Tissierellales bacterium]
MENILIVFLDGLEDIEGLNKIIEQFDLREYKMYLYDNIRDTDLDFSELPDIVEFYKNQHKNVNRIVILSNLRDLIFSWFRCYNSIVDDFIYLLDKEENHFFSVEDKHYTFYSNLYGFCGIEQETISSKIYSTINFENYHKIIDFLIRNNNFKYFDSFDNFDFITGGKEHKRYINKKYILNKYEYSFEVFNTRDFEKINMVKSNKQELIISDSFINEVCNNVFIIPYVTVLFYRTGEQIYTNLLLTIYKYLKNIDKQKQEVVFDRLFTHINRKDLDFKEKIYISSLLVMIHNENAKLTEFMMKTLLEDERYIEYHYEIVSNILFYCSNENLNNHFNYYMDLRDEVGKIANWVSREMNKEISRKNNDNMKIAILVDQLLSIKHSPTKVMLDYAKNIIEYYPEYEVKIFVEDNLYCLNKEGIISYLYSSGISERCKEEHQSYLNNHDIKIYYCDLSKPKKNRTLDLVKEIDMFQPQAILTNSDISLTARILYGTYPITYISMGGDYFWSMADIYLCAYRERIIQSNHKYGLLEESKIIEIIHGLEFNKPYKKITRKDYQINEDDFVLISVGNRLNAEMDEQFIDYIINFIMKNDRAKWLIVGPKAIPYLENKCYGLLGDKIIAIEYEEDLQALYRICDVYVNPIRQSGGISIAMAMNVGLPVIATENSSAAAYYIGKENTSKNIEDYLLELNKIFTNKSYKEFRSEEVRKNIKKFEFEKVIKYLIQYLR